MENDHKSEIMEAVEKTMEEYSSRNWNNMFVPISMVEYLRMKVNDVVSVYDGILNEYIADLKPDITALITMNIQRLNGILDDLPCSPISVSSYFLILDSIMRIHGDANAMEAKCSISRDLLELGCVKVEEKKGN